MFEWLKGRGAEKGAAPSDAPAERKPRGVMPTYVTENSLVLCKSGTAVQDTYEVRLCLYFAVRDKRQFVLGVSSNAQVDLRLRSKIEENGGVVREMNVTDYSVFIGHKSDEGKELDGWVLGDRQAWESFLASFSSAWLRERLRVGASFQGSDVAQLEGEIRRIATSQKNVDDENLRDALLLLVAAAKAGGGALYVQ